MTGPLDPRPEARLTAGRPTSHPMAGPLDRAAGFFLAPAAGAHAPAATTLPTPTRAVVLGTADDAPPLAAALALSLRASDRSAAALVATWSDGESDRSAAGLAPTWSDGGGGSPAPDERSSAGGVDTRTSRDRARHGSPARGAAAPGASRLAARLRRRDLPARARGRLVWLDLPSEPGAAGEVVRQAAAIVDGPVVTALAGARPRQLDRLVEEHDLVVVAADPASPLARAALAGLPHGRLALACRPLRRGLPRAVALAGLAAPRLDPPVIAPRRERV